VRFGALGDIHGDFDTVRRIMERHREVPFWLCVGDVATADGRYEPFPAPLYFIKGNNENFDELDRAEVPRAGSEDPASVRRVLGNLFYIPNGLRITIEGVRVAGLGGTHAPTVYELAAADLPHPKKGTPKATEAADRRRHFVREEVDACKALRDVDLLLTHEAPRPFRVHRGIDAGKTPINDVLAAMKPRLHLFGHHHRFVAGAAQGVPSICLDSVGASYLLIDGNTLEYQQLTS
jgi:Icc-related predicted phosphoesterase